MEKTMPNPDGSPTAAEIAEAAVGNLIWVEVRQYRGVTMDTGAGDYAFNPGDWVAIPRTAVAQLRIDQMIY